MREARERNLRVTIQGARTGVAAGAVPFGGIVLSMTRMNRILGLRHENNECFARVQAGVRLSELRHWLAVKHSGFFFPPDPTETTASLGGMNATNASGACSYQYGPMRNYVNALEVVLADGKIFHHIRRPSSFVPRLEIKNAAGFYMRDDADELDLFIGSGGQLGVITELELKLLPRPKIEWGLVCFFANENDAIDVVEKTRGERTFLSVHSSLKNGQECPFSLIAAIEFFDRGCLALLREDVGRGGAFWPRIETEWDCAVYFEIHAPDEETAIETVIAAARMNVTRSRRRRIGRSLSRST